VRQEREPRASPPGNARDEVRSVGDLGVELALDAVRVEVCAEQFGSGCLVARRVDGVDADQLLKEPRDLVGQRGRGSRVQRRVPSTSRYSRVCRTPPFEEYSRSKNSTHVRWNSARRSSSSESASVFVGP
jgi:hypothetical protein